MLQVWLLIVFLAEDYRDHIDILYQELNTEEAVLKTMLTEVKANMENEHEFIWLAIVCWTKRRQEKEWLVIWDPFQRFIRHSADPRVNTFVHVNQPCNCKNVRISLRVKYSLLHFSFSATWIYEPLLNIPL